MAEATLAYMRADIPWALSQRKLSSTHLLSGCVIMGKFVDFEHQRFLQRIVVRIRRMTFNISSTVPGTHDWSSMNGNDIYDG